MVRVQGRREWYELPARFADDDEAPRRAAHAVFIRQLCGMEAGDPDRRRASGEAIADDPEFGGDESFARSAILVAPTACGLDE